MKLEGAANESLLVHIKLLLSTQNRVQEAAIYVGTQERIVERKDIENVDLLVIDEFYKLDARQNDDRSLTLNLLLAKIGLNAKQIYLSGPLIEKVEISGALAGRIAFYRSDFSPVAADLIDLTERSDSVEALIEVLSTYPDDQTLIYSGSPPRANSLGATLVFRQVHDPKPNLNSLVRWAADNFHPAWSVLRPLHCGIGVHHGSVPRSLAQLFVRLFEKKAIQILICTSTLIEGVNTSAKNICVFDKTIDGKKGLSYFQFQNIKGRAGRLGRHYVGRIFLFNNPPRPDAFQPEIPALSDYSTASDEFVVQLPSTLMDESGLARKARALQDRLLSPALMEKWGRYGIENLEDLAEAVWDQLEARDTSLIWSGWGTYDQIYKTAEFLWASLKFNKHGLSAKQFAHFANCFRRSKKINDTLNYIISRSAGHFEPEKTVEDFFDFLKGAEYTFPNAFDVLNDILLEYDDGRLDGVVEYSFFSTGLRNWFLSGVLKGLDEYGVPHPIIQKAESRLNHRDFDTAIAQLKALAGTDFFEPVENQILAICFEEQP